MSRTISEMALPPEGPLDARLRALYDWITANVVRTDVQMFEELERSRDEKRKRNVIEDVMSRREGSATAVQLLFAAVTRTLGAEAHLVLVTDRTHNYFDSGLRSIRQIDSTLVALPSPGGTPGRRVG